MADTKDTKKKTSTEKEDDIRSVKKKRSAKVIKHTTMATVLTVIFIAVVVLINAVASILFERYPLTIDLTENSMYSISDESIDYIKGIDAEIHITVLCEETEFSSLNEYTLQAMELLKRYQEYNQNIKVSYTDLLTHPEVTSNYPSVDLHNYDIIFETKNTSSDDESFQRIKVLKITDLASWDSEFISQMSEALLTYYGMSFEQYCDSLGAATVMNGYRGYIVGSNAEAAFTSAIMSITDPDPVVVTFLTGHNEVSQLEYFKKMLDANGYQVGEINILTEEIPEDTDLIVIPAPSQDYIDEEIKKISDFLLNGGALEKDALYIASVQQGETPKLDEFLEEYGLKVEPALIMEGDSNRYYDPRLPSYAMPSIVSENYMQDMNTADYLLLMPNARAITLLYDEQSMKVTEAYVQSSDMAYTCGYDSYGFDTSDIRERGVQTSVAVGSKAVFGEGDDYSTYYSNIMVISSDEFLADSWLQASQFQNSEYIISLLNGMTGKTNTGIVIAPKTIIGNTFDLTGKQASILKWTFQLVIPLIVLIIGFVIYKRRKNK